MWFVVSERFVHQPEVLFLSFLNRNSAFPNIEHLTKGSYSCTVELRWRPYIWGFYQPTAFRQGFNREIGRM